MYPSRFQYEAPKTIAEAITLLSEAGGEAKVLAGGQSLIPMMKLRFASPQMIVDINNIEGLDHLDFASDGTIRIGALCRHAALERSAELGMRQPVMASAAPLVADPIVRNRGTFVGSLCHADPQGDWASVMVALGGSLIVEGPSRQRSIPVSDLIHGPFQTVLAHDEIGVEAVIPAPVGTPMGGYLKLERRVGRLRHCCRSSECRHERCNRCQGWNRPHWRRCHHDQCHGGCSGTRRRVTERGGDRRGR